MENKSNPVICTGMFKDQQSAENAYRALLRKGYGRNDVNIIMTEDTREKYFSDARTEVNRIAAGAGRGSVSGGTIEAIDNIIAVAGTNLTLPGLDLLVAGPIAGGLAGAGAGDFIGSVIGALLGIPDPYGQKFESGIKDGYVVISVCSSSEEELAFIENIWKENNVDITYKK